MRPSVTIRSILECQWDQIGPKYRRVYDLGCVHPLPSCKPSWPMRRSPRRPPLHQPSAEGMFSVLKTMQPQRSSRLPDWPCSRISHEPAAQRITLHHEAAFSLQNRTVQHYRRTSFQLSREISFGYIEYARETGSERCRDA